ncbi:RGG repeats nuclear RNA binding protein A-like [Vigna radiata var. radiata]|uniref:RGG repeats nuclear RNA binding protein A-like n=1 Tax=Vigna radiata var. radiata TaxID=3916 RepID=A0A1S3V8E1_VIGRR|nr:RGG repeats nuclear RNA binding protein A-like [Vigna radiata var. radiata]
MQQLSNKKDNDNIFIKLSVSINEFLKPPEGESFYSAGGRGRGRGRGRGARGGYGGYPNANVPAPSIEDPGQFPTLGEHFSTRLFLCFFSLVVEHCVGGVLI